MYEETFWNARGIFENKQDWSIVWDDGWTRHTARLHVPRHNLKNEGKIDEKSADKTTNVTLNGKNNAAGIKFIITKWWSGRTEARGFSRVVFRDQIVWAQRDCVSIHHIDCFVLVNLTLFMWLLSLPSLDYEPGLRKIHYAGVDRDISMTCSKYRKGYYSVTSSPQLSFTLNYQELLNITQTYTITQSSLWNTYLWEIYWQGKRAAELKQLRK